MAKIQQNPQKPGGNSLLTFICLLFLFYFAMSMFRSKDVPTQQNAESFQQMISSVDAQNPVALDPNFKPEEGTKALPTPDEETGKVTAATASEPAVPKELDIPQQFISLGSADPESPYRMLVTLTNEGAAVAAVELNEPRLGSMSDDPQYKGGYVGFLNFDESSGAFNAEPQGCLVQIVGKGTPAEKAGVRAGDVIRKVKNVDVLSAIDFREKIGRCVPGSKVPLTLTRDGKEIALEVVPVREPVRVIRPENGDPHSFLTTLSQLDANVLPAPMSEVKDSIPKNADETVSGQTGLRGFLDLELQALKMRTANWEVEKRNENSVTFLQRVPHAGLEVRKTYILVLKSDSKNAQDYHLNINVEVKNVGTLARKVAIQQDGPAGLLTEGDWYCQKASRNWSACGIRDIIVGHEDKDTPDFVTCRSISDGKWGNFAKTTSSPIRYVGVDAQYFAAIMIPHKDGTVPVSEITSLRMGDITPKREILTNTSFRLRSELKELVPGTSVEQKFTVFVGPKRPALLSEYGLDNVVYYGWFSFIAKMLVATLHVFYALVHNYGIAIIMLTILVRLLMFPLSLKQVKSTLVMQSLQPEIKKLQEKYTDPMERQRAQMELFKKHNYNPMSGCWVMLVQLPIFIALYRALLVDVELRQAPLFGSTFRFCSDLAAPDKFLYWGNWVWDFISAGYGFFGLGPYLNLLPIVTIIIFIVQQKVFMPPALDDQARMQQKMMKYMMVFMGFMFFKVPSGLCLYFIVSSLWGLAERRFMPKTVQASTPGVIEATYSSPDVPKKETFFQRAQRLAGRAPEKQETPQERNRRRKGKGGR